MDRRTVLKLAGVSTTIFFSGCSSDGDEESTSTKNHHTAINSSSDDFPSYSGTATISGDDDFWSFGLNMANTFVLSYTVSNNKSDKFDFDVFVFSQQEYDNYVETVQGNHSSPDAIDSASSEGVRTSASKTVEMDAGTYYFVVDNTDIGDAGDFGSEETREIQIELQTGRPGEVTSTKTPTETVTTTPTPQAIKNEIGEPFEVGNGDRTIRYVVREAYAQETIGGDVIYEEADGVFLIVELSMTNQSDETFNITTDHFKMVNSEGQLYEVVSETNYISADDRISVDPIFFEDLQPSLETTGAIAFDVPHNMAFNLLIEPVGFLSSARPHYVPIGTTPGPKQ